jgi:hypothetical protein
MKSSHCIKPNADKNVKLAQQLSTNRRIVRQVWLVLILTASALFPPPSQSGDEFIPLPSAPPATASQTPTEEQVLPPPDAVQPAPVTETADSAPTSPPEVSRGADKKAEKKLTTWNSEEAVLPITATKYNVIVQRKNTSGRLYVLDFGDQALPKTSEILLLKSAMDPVMALRVIKTVPSGHTIIAQVVKKYPNHTELQNAAQYDAIAKLGDIRGSSDIIAAPEAEFEDPNWEKSNQEEKTLAYDPELDVGSSSPEEVAASPDDGKSAPVQNLETKVAYLESKLVSLESKIEKGGLAASDDSENRNKSKKHDNDSEKKIIPSGSDTSADKLDNDLLDRDEPSMGRDSTSIDEIKYFDNYSHWLGVGFGYITSLNSTGTSLVNATAGNLRYGVTLGRRIFFDKVHAQDSIALEGAGYIYKWINFAAAGDSYTVLAGVGSFRYNLFFNSGFGIYAYGGALQANVISNSNGVATAIAVLNSLLPSFGGGVLLEIGPGWFARLNIGYEDTSLNLLLRF